VPYGSAVTTSLPELSLADWMVLGIVAEAPTHGWPIVHELGPTGSLGRVWTVARPVVYRSLTTLETHGLLERCGAAPGVRGPQRTIVRATRAGRAALRHWLRTPVTHVREVRSELLVKLALLDRAGEPRDELVARQIAALEPVLRAVSTPPACDGFDEVLAGWRREQALAVERFLRGLRT
jgi:PadR family transcriptional regulator AphA